MGFYPEHGFHPRGKVYGRIWTYWGPISYADVMREAGDNSLIAPPSQPPAEHTAHLPAWMYERLEPKREPVDDRDDPRCEPLPRENRHAD
jgi:hypothetical protein